MDTDELSGEAYKGIVSEAERLNHDLTLQFGLLAEDCKNENEYLDQAENLAREILELENYELVDLFWGNPPDKRKLKRTLSKMIIKIGAIKQIPVEKRHYG